MVRNFTRRDLVALLAILSLAAVLRLPGLAARGQWDADQGNEMLVLLHLVRDGQVPTLGPSTFAGTFHHGALYYYLLAPAAFLSDADPRAVTLELALIGIATVAAIWGLGRTIAGPWAGHVAGMLAAVSPAGILSSTFIWNPNVVPLGSAIALLGATKAWRTGREAWWLVAAVGAMAAMQTHVSGGLLIPPLVAAFAVDLRRRPPGRRRGFVLAGVGAVAVLALGYLPLLAHELVTGFSDARGLIGYLGGGAGATGDVGSRILTAALRSIAWPFVGVITEAPIVGSAVIIVVAGLSAAAVRLLPRSDRAGIWLLLATLAWSLPALAVTAPTLSTSVPGLPNDHYHMFLDPLVIGLAAAGIAALAAAGSKAPPAIDIGVAGRLVGIVGLIGLVGVCVVRWPPASAPDGGWPLADAAAVRLADDGAGQASMALVSIPDVKSADALRFPLERRGVVPLPAEPPPSGSASPVSATITVIVCDPLFDEVDGAACGGAAESRWLAEGGGDLQLADRFEAGPRRIISVYQRAGS